MRKKLLLLTIASLFVSFSCTPLKVKDRTHGLRVTQGIDEAHRAVVKAYDSGAKERAPYLYSKARAYKEVSYILASEMDDVGANVFSIRSINYASMSITSAFLGGEKPTQLNQLNTEKLAGKEDILSMINVDELRKDIMFLRANKGLKCAPVQTGKAEAFYDALVYELNKDEPNPSIVLRFYNEANTESKVAKNKVLIAKKNKLKCYVGEQVVKKAPQKRKVMATGLAVQKSKPESSKRPELHKEPLKIVARIHFDFDKYNIKKEYKPILNEVVKTLKQNPYVELVIEGYTDNIGPKKYNDKLALKRARSVKNYLVKHGIPAEKIKIVGIGKDRYIATNRTSVGRLTNRRVEFILIKKAEKP